MKKAMLFVVALLFSVGVNAATLSLATNTTSDSYVSQEVSSVFNHGNLVIGSGEVGEADDASKKWRSGFVLHTDGDTPVRVEWVFNPSVNFEGATLKLAKIADDGFTLLDPKLYNIMGSFSFSALITEGDYALEIVDAKSGILDYSVSVSAVPVPAALFLFAPALLGFLGLRRKTAVAAA